MAISSQKYSTAEETEVSQWLQTAERLKSSPSDASILDTLNTHLSTRSTLLGTKPSKADTAIYSALAPTVKSWTPGERTGQAGRPNVVRYLDFVQNSPVFELSVSESEKITVDPEEILYVKPPVDAKAEKERLKKEKAAALAAAQSAAQTATNAAQAAANAAPGVAQNLVDRTKAAINSDQAAQLKDAAATAATNVAGTASNLADAAVAAVQNAVGAATGAPEGQKQQKREKKEKKPKQPQPPAAPAVLSPCLIDLRVGHILKAIKHPEADSLYVSTIAMGDKPGTDDTTEYEGQVCRTVCSGLNGLVPLEEMQGRKVVVVANLKPVKMRGIKSSAMVLAASPKIKEGEADDHKGPVELVTPPADAKAGERVYFEGWAGEPEKVLNPKKKVWEMFQPGFTTTSDLEVAFDASVVPDLKKEGLGKLVVESGGVCKVKSLAGAQVR
ncbi:G4 quadruplex nucleic acid binding protein [Coniochaeta pulveracea]|uniref:G4 quadruplex nucleic acid binding protein n=1 Tax=Coniochaeta pulveracea TaxID=177199 RepID=A0A420YH48_9PEZI|nr:G4 quadruplex nucleic acid binding protein [Coniochaeta pulveracea]